MKKSYKLLMENGIKNTIKCNIQWPSHFCSFNDVKQLNVKTKNSVF